MVGYFFPSHNYLFFLLCCKSNLYICIPFLAHLWHYLRQIIRIINPFKKVKNMGITLSFIFCLLSGFVCFWLFWKCVDWFENI